MFLTALQTPNRVISLRGCVVSRMSEPTLLRGPQRYPSRGAWGRVCLCGGKGRGAAVVMKIDMQTDRLRGIDWATFWYHRGSSAGGRHTMGKCGMRAGTLPWNWRVLCLWMCGWAQGDRGTMMKAGEGAEEKRSPMMGRRLRTCSVWGRPRALHELPREDVIPRQVRRVYIAPAEYAQRTPPRLKPGPAYVPPPDHPPPATCMSTHSPASRTAPPPAHPRRPPPCVRRGGDTRC